MYVCTYVRMHVRMYERMYVCTYVRMYERMYERMYVCTYVRMYVRMYERMYVRKYVCIYVCLSVCLWYIKVCAFINHRNFRVAYLRFFYHNSKALVFDLHLSANGTAQNPVVYHHDP